MSYITYVIDCNQFGNKYDEESIATSQSPIGYENDLPIVNLETSKSEDVENLLIETDSVVQHQYQTPDFFETMTVQESTLVRFIFFRFCSFLSL